MISAKAYIASLGLSEEDKLFAASVCDKISAARERYRSSFMGFMTEGKAELALKIIHSQCFENFMFYGGYDDAERVMPGFFAEYETPSENSFPVKGLTISFRKTALITHRDVLGALMGMGIVRESVGDILVGTGEAFVFLSEIAANETLMHLTKVGREGVSVAEGIDINRLPKREFIERNGVVASLRADCIAAFAASCSRSEAERLISSGRMSVRGQVITKVSESLVKGDVFTIRGHGKFVLSDIGGTTKKDRISITINKYK